MSNSMNEIRIGNQSAFSALTPMLPFEYAVANGFDAFEWFPDKQETGQGWSEGDMDVETRLYIKDTASEHNIVQSVHASLKGNLLTEESSEILFNDIKFAQNVGAALLNIHLITDEGMEKFIKSVRSVIRYTARAGIKLSIENTPMTGPGDFNELFTLLDNDGKLPTSHVGMCFDIGHANLHEDTHNDYLKYIDLIGPHVPVIHMHFHENRGDRDSHLPFFTGPAGKDTASIQKAVKIMKKRGFSGSVILEQWPEPPLLLNEARDRLYHMFNDRH